MDSHSSSQLKDSHSFSSVQNTLSEFEHLNPIDVLTPNEIIDNVKIYDSTM